VSYAHATPGTKGAPPRLTVLTKSPFGANTKHPRSRLPGAFARQLSHIPAAFGRQLANRANLGRDSRASRSESTRSETSHSPTSRSPNSRGPPSSCQPSSQPSSVSRGASPRPSLETSEIFAKGPRMYFVLLLNAWTFRGTAGIALERELRSFVAAGVTVVLVHEQRVGPFGACDFDEFFTTGAALQRDLGLFRRVAIPLFDPPYQATSLALVVRAIGGQPVERQKRWSVRRMISRVVTKRPKAPSLVHSTSIGRIFEGIHGKATHIQARFRGHHWRGELRSMQRAAVLIQSTFFAAHLRGCFARLARRSAEAEPKTVSMRRRSRAHGVHVAAAHHGVRSSRWALLTLACVLACRSCQVNQAIQVCLDAVEGPERPALSGKRIAHADNLLMRWAREAAAESSSVSPVLRYAAGSTAGYVQPPSSQRMSFTRPSHSTSPAEASNGRMRRASSSGAVTIVREGAAAHGRAHLSPPRPQVKRSLTVHAFVDVAKRESGVSRFRGDSAASAQSQLSSRSEASGRSGRVSVATLANGAGVQHGAANGAESERSEPSPLAAGTPAPPQPTAAPATPNHRRSSFNARL
jgi:hypothetical protein